MGVLGYGMTACVRQLKISGESPAKMISRKEWEPCICVTFKNQCSVKPACGFFKFSDVKVAGDLKFVLWEQHPGLRADCGRTAQVNGIPVE